MEPVPYLCAVSLKPSCDEFLEPMHVRKGHCTHTLKLGNSRMLAHENRFSILASDSDEKALDGCDTAKHVTKVKSRSWKIRGERDE